MLSDFIVGFIKSACGNDSFRGSFFVKLPDEPLPEDDLPMQLPCFNPIVFYAAMFRKFRVFCLFQEHHKLHELINTTSAFF